MNISDKLAKVDETFEVTRLDNGFTVEVRGETEDGDWETVKIVCLYLTEVHALFDEFESMRSK